MNEPKKNYYWLIISGVASTVTMCLTTVALLVPLKWAIVPIFGLLAFFWFMRHNPVERYMRLAVYVVGVWGGVIFSSSYDFGLKIGSQTSVWARIGETEWYIHLFIASFASLLVILDFNSRVSDFQKEKALTKNRLLKYQYQLRFVSIAIGLFTLAIITEDIAQVANSKSQPPSTEVISNSSTITGNQSQGDQTIVTGNQSQGDQTIVVGNRIGILNTVDAASQRLRRALAATGSLISGLGTSGQLIDNSALQADVEKVVKALNETKKPHVNSQMSDIERDFATSVEATVANAKEEHDKVLRLYKDGDRLSAQEQRFLEQCRVLGEAHYWKENWAQAGKYYGVVYSLSDQVGNKWFAQIRLALCMKASGNPVAASGSLENALKFLDKFGEEAWQVRVTLLHNLSNCYYEWGRQEDRKDLLEKALKKVNSAIDVALRHKADWVAPNGPQGVNNRRRVIPENSAHNIGILLMTKAGCLLELNRQELALKTLDESLDYIVKHAPGSHSHLVLLRNRGLCLESLERWSDAEKAFGQLIQESKKMYYSVKKNETVLNLVAYGYIHRSAARINLKKNDLAEDDMKALRTLIKKEGYDVEGKDVNTIEEALRHGK